MEPESQTPAQPSPSADQPKKGLKIAELLKTRKGKIILAALFVMPLALAGGSMVMFGQKQARVAESDALPQPGLNAPTPEAIPADTAAVAASDTAAAPTKAESGKNAKAEEKKPVEVAKVEEKKPAKQEEAKPAEPKPEPVEIAKPKEEKPSEPSFVRRVNGVEIHDFRGRMP